MTISASAIASSVRVLIVNNAVWFEGQAITRSETLPDLTANEIYQREPLSATSFPTRAPDRNGVKSAQSR